MVARMGTNSERSEASAVSFLLLFLRVRLELATIYGRTRWDMSYDARMSMLFTGNGECFVVCQCCCFLLCVVFFFFCSILVRGYERQIRLDVWRDDDDACGDGAGLAREYKVMAIFLLKPLHAV